MSSPIIEVRNLSKRYRLGQIGARSLREEVERLFSKIGNRQSTTCPGQQVGVENSQDFWALRDVSFDVQPGEVLGIIGRNGAGKSTLLKILSRITEPTSGEAILRGRVASLLEVGTGFHPELTGRENVYLNGTILGMKKREITARFDEIVAFAEMDRHIDTPVKRYSSGQRVRLAFAVAAHLDSEILIVDEVLAVGDVQFQKKCLQTMEDVACSGKAVIFVSHHTASVGSLCRSAIYLEQGRVEYSGTVTDALRLYQGEGSDRAAQHWHRPAELPLKAMMIQSVAVTLGGKQPELYLDINVELKVSEVTKPVFIAFDLRDQLAAPVMQILPRLEPFIDGRVGFHKLRISATLPGLIPGIYLLDAWIGSHHTETMDHVRSVVVFEITTSPLVGRSYPFSADHGAIALPSHVEYPVVT